MIFERITVIDGSDGNVSGNGNSHILSDQYVVVTDGLIAYVGSERPAGDFGRVIDGNNRLLMPGFYNTHAHSPMTLMRGYGENLALSEWLNERIFPFEDQLDSDGVYHAALLAAAESLRYGIVSTSDMYFFTDDIARAVTESGVKSNLARCLTSFDESVPMKSMPAFEEADRLYRDFNGAADGRLIADASLHAEYTATPRLVREIVEDALFKHQRMQVHISETKDEHEACKERHDGQTPVQFFSSLGLFDVPTTAAHCVWTDADDIRIMAEKGVTVASNPVSNLKLASGIADVPAFMKAGVPVTIGTDGVASNNSLNYLEDVKYFALVNKERRADPTLITPQEAVFAATRAGALAQGRTDCGLIKEGYKADLIVFDTAGPQWHPVHDVLNNLVYAASGSDVVMTIVDGQVLYDHGEWPTIDVERAKSGTGAAAERMLAAL
jgi:5-methylthioadenosine/S-adenosylhomocysteine deaminase